MVRTEQLLRSREKVGSWGRIVPARAEALLAHAGGSVLDIGCSSGAYVRLLRENGRQAFGCDLLWHEEWRALPEPCCFAADLKRLPLPNGAVETCVAFEVLEHLEDAECGLREMHRVCRKNIIISVPNCSQEPVFQAAGLAYHHWTDRTHLQQFTEESLCAALQKGGFKVTHLSRINPIAPEIMTLHVWRVPLGLARMAGIVLRRFPLRRGLYMTLLAVASKKG